MIELPKDLPQLIFLYLMPFIRITAMVMALPIIGSHLVPAKIKLMISIGITLIVITSGEVHLTNITQVPWIYIVLSIGYQIIIGVLFGLIIHTIFQAFNIAGQVIAMQMGLGFAQMVDPQSGVSVPTVSQFFMMVATLLYLSMNGHLYVISALVESFKTMPAMINDFAPIEFDEVFSLGTMMFSYAIKIALPAIVALLVTNIAFGVMTKAAPQFNIFTLGFSISMILGIGLIWINLAFILPVFTDLSENVHVALLEATR
ncbi:MAG: flagellar biosynthetic protein FliR [Candidatus Berkiella sp.]